jgi:hypothetical protein
MTKRDQTGYEHDYDVPSHAEAAHEQVEFDREIQYRQLIWMGVVLLVTALVSGVLVFFLLKGFIHDEDKKEGAIAPPIAIGPTEMSAPKLLARPAAELQRVHDAEAEQLDSYGWVDAQGGIARIPIERAIDIAAAKGAVPDVGAGLAAPAPPPAAPGSAAPAAGAATGAPAASPAPSASPAGAAQ